MDEEKKGRCFLYICVHMRIRRTPTFIVMDFDSSFLLTPLIVRVRQNEAFQRELQAHPDLAHLGRVNLGFGANRYRGQLPVPLGSCRKVYMKLCWKHGTRLSRPPSRDGIPWPRVSSPRETHVEQTDWSIQVAETKPLLPHGRKG